MLTHGHVIFVANGRKISVVVEKAVQGTAAGAAFNARLDKDILG
jgi:hypothetical protein